MITICFVYFKSLTLANLAAALYSVRQQDLSSVKEIVIVDNDTVDAEQDVAFVAHALDFPVPVRLLSFKHGDPTKTHSWSTNVAVRETTTPWVLFTRADYLLSFDLIRKFIEAAHGRTGFVTSDGCHLFEDVAACERTRWRTAGPNIFHGVEFNYTCIDAGVWMARRNAFDAVVGLDESLTAWGHAQTDFQYRLYRSGVKFVRVPETLFYHPLHAAMRNLDLAHQQLRERGIDIKELWARHEGIQPY